MGTPNVRRWGGSLLVVVALGLGWWALSGADDPRTALDGLPQTPALAVLAEMGRGQGVTPAEGRHMHDLIVSRGYSRGLEVGTAHGYCAIWFGMAASRTGGSVVTIEIDPATAEKARANIRRAGLGAVIDARTADAFQAIPRLDGDFDFVFLDTGLGEDQRFLDLLRARIRPGGVVMAHNATFMRWQQPGFWRSIHTPTEFETTVFGRVAIARRLTSH